MGNANQPEYDLCERTAKFGEASIRFCRAIKPDVVTASLIRQLIRAATSIGANYVEADEAGSKKEFRYRLSICRRETKETQYWLRMLVAASPSQRDASAVLWKEARELLLIFSAIHRKSDETEQLK